MGKNSFTLSNLLETYYSAIHKAAGLMVHGRSAGFPGIIPKRSKEAAVQNAPPPRDRSVRRLVNSTVNPLLLFRLKKIENLTIVAGLSSNTAGKHGNQGNQDDTKHWYPLIHPEMIRIKLAFTALFIKSISEQWTFFRHTGVEPVEAGKP